MPKVAQARQVGTSNINGVPVTLHELDAKTKDSDGKETKFTYQFPRFDAGVNLDDVVKALTYTNSKKEVVDGKSVILDYVNTALKNEKRGAKLSEINTTLKLREDPEAAKRSMIDQMVIAFGVPREIAEANVTALLAKGQQAREAQSQQETAGAAK
jgi:hypothetical protein